MSILFCLAILVLSFDQLRAISTVCFSVLLYLMIPAFFHGMELMFFVLHGLNTEEMAVTSFITVHTHL